MESVTVPMSRTKNVSRNITWGIFNKFVAIAFPFITRTVMIYTLGMYYVGLGSLFSSILTVMSFAELGIGSALVFSMYKPMAQGDEKKISALLNFYKMAYRRIGLVILFMGIIISPFLDYLVTGDIPSEINLQKLFFLYVLNNLLGYFLYTYKQSLFIASQRVDMISKIELVLQILSNVAQIAILLTIRDYYLYVLVLPVITLLNNLAIGVMADKAFPQYKCVGILEKNELMEIKKKVGGMLFQKIGNIVLTAADTIVISSFIGLKVLGIYNGYYYVIVAIAGFMGVIQQALIPSIGNSIVTDSEEKNLHDFKKFQLMYLWIVIWACSCLLCLYQPFIELWQSSINMLDDEIVYILVGYFFVHRMGDINWMYRESMGLWWEARLVPLVSSVVNLITNIILVQFIGLAGVLISTIISLAVVNFPWSSKVTFTYYFKSKNEWFKYMARTGFYFIVMLVVAFSTYQICLLVPVGGYVCLLVRGMICALAPNVLLVVINIKNPAFKPAGRLVLKILPNAAFPSFVKRYFA